MRSLKSKLVSGLIFSLVIAFTLLWLLVSVSLETVAEDYVASRLGHDGETLLAAVHFNADGSLRVERERINVVYNQPFSGHYYTIHSGSQTLRSRSLWDQDLPTLSPETGHTLQETRPGPQHQALLVTGSGYRKQGRALTIITAEDLTPIRNNIRQFRNLFAAIAAAMLLLLVILQILILRKSLQPLGRISAELQSLEQGQREKLDTDVPTELKPLIHEVNHLLAIMAQRLRRSRDALSDLAHALKKPLTVIQQTADHGDLPEPARATLDSQSQQIYRLTDRILKRARLAGPSHGGTLFSFTEDLPALIQTLDMMHGDKTLQVRQELSDSIHSAVDREDMLELLGNLLDNAYKWARQVIRIRVVADGELHIGIEDDGPGAEPEQIDALARRGVRLDEAIEGHGFGLAIAADMVADYQGRMTFRRSQELGGFQVDIYLPMS